MNVVKELAALIRLKVITTDQAAAHIGVSAEELDRWLAGEEQPSGFFLGLLPGIVDDMSRLYSDAAERKE